MAGKGQSTRLENAEQIRGKFKDLLAKTNKEHPRAEDVKALSDLLSGNRSLELWREVASAGQLAELTVIENAIAVPALKECWKHRLQVLKKDLGNEGAPILEQLLIQHAALCWLKLNLIELNYSSAMKQSITLTLGIYWKKRLTAAQRDLRERVTSQTMSQNAKGHSCERPFSSFC